MLAEDGAMIDFERLEYFAPTMLRRRVTLQEHARSRGLHRPEYLGGAVAISPQIRFERYFKPLLRVMKNGDEVWEWAWRLEGKVRLLGLALLREGRVIGAWSTDAVHQELGDCPACQGSGLSAVGSEAVCFLCDGFGKETTASS